MRKKRGEFGVLVPGIVKYGFMRIMLRMIRSPHEAFTMHRLFDENAPKKPTNLSVNRDLLAKSRALRINLSATLEEALETELAAAQAENWKKENAAAIRAYNAFVDENGCFGDAFREF